MAKETFTFDNMMEVLAQYDAILEAAKMLLPEYISTHQHDPKALASLTRSSNYVCAIGFDSESVYFEGDEYWAYDGHETHEITMPLAFVYSSEYRARLARECAEKQEQAILAATQKHKQVVDNAKAKRKAMYEELKKEFE